jgi:hypothetical protein
VLEIEDIQWNTDRILVFKHLNDKHLSKITTATITELMAGKVKGQQHCWLDLYGTFQCIHQFEFC